MRPGESNQSVLGVGGYKYNGILPSGTDLNNLTDEHLSYYISNADNISHIPSAIRGGVLQCLIQVDRFYDSQYNVVQKLIVIPDIVTFTRCYSNGEWTDWHRVYDDGILNNSTILGQLAAALGDIFFNANGLYDNEDQDLNNRGVGFSYCVNAPNQPSAYSVVLTLKRGALLYQIAYNGENLWMRNKGYQGWSSWVQK